MYLSIYILEHSIFIFVVIFILNFHFLRQNQVFVFNHVLFHHYNGIFKDFVRLVLVLFKMEKVTD